MKTQKKRLNASRESGFTLVELMVALVIAAILIVGIFQLYRSTQNTYLAQDQLAELQQNARIGIEQMIREMRLAGYLANCTPTQGSSSPVSALFEFDADTDLNGTPERIKYEYDSTKREISRYAHSPAPIPASCGPAYAFSGSEKQIVASDVESLKFTFYDKNDGKPVATPQEIRRVTIDLQVATAAKDLVLNRKRIVAISSDVRLRNEGLKGGGSCTPPTMPSGLLASDPKICGRAKLAWTAASAAATEGVNGYRIYTRPLGSLSWTTTDVGNVTNYILSGLVDKSNPPYEFAVAAQNNCAVSGLSNFMTLTLNDDIPPVVPTGVNAPSASTTGS